MIYPVDGKTAVSSIPKDAKQIHLVRAIGAKKLAQLLERCGSISRISVSRSASERIGPNSRKLIRERGVSLVGAEHRGRAIGLELGEMLKVIDMHRDDKTYREIEQLTGIPKSTVHYLVRYAERAKVKDGSRTVYLG